MMLKAVLIWITGLLTLVPYGTYYLFVHATQDQYALLIVLVLFWIFGYWGVVGPLLAALKVRSVFRAIVQAHARGQLKEALRSPETRALAVEIIASENRIPRFLADRVYRLLAERLTEDRQG
ncbi:MAG: hypothetical protein ACOY3X_09470 [Pseudomonadota bacterium]